MTDARTKSLQSAAERFTRETKHHKLEVLHDDGLYRHLRFMSLPDGKPKYSAYWFDLITVPGALIFRGDGESFVFARVEDMFEFFRSNPDRTTMRISPDHWAEKLTSDRDRVKAYSREKFEQHVAEALKDAEENWPGVTAEWKSETEDSIDYDLDYEDGAREALRDFSYMAAGHDSTFRFEDTYEWDLRDFDWWYLWACHAIVFGIAQYDAARVPAEGHGERMAEALEGGA